MQAAVLREIGKPVEIVELRTLAPRAGEVRLELAASGVCRSDLSVATGTLKSPLPVVLGHEAAGVVAELGEGVTGLTPGDRVVVSLTPACGSCLFCQEGHPNRCVQMVPGMVNSTRLDGSTRLRCSDEAIYQLCAWPRSPRRPWCARARASGWSPRSRSPRLAYWAAAC